MEVTSCGLSMLRTGCETMSRMGRTYDPDFGLKVGCKSLEGPGWKGYERDRWEAWGERLRPQGRCVRMRE